MLLVIRFLIVVYLIFIPDLVLSHDIYNNLMNKQGSMSCCSNSDCRPVDYRLIKDGVEFRIDNTWVFVLEKYIQYKQIPGDETELKAHWCGRKIVINGSYDSYVTFCAFLPPQSM